MPFRANAKSIVLSLTSVTHLCLHTACLTSPLSPSITSSCNSPLTHTQLTSTCLHIDTAFVAEGRLSTDGIDDGNEHHNRWREEQAVVKHHYSTQARSVVTFVHLYLLPIVHIAPSTIQHFNSPYSTRRARRCRCEHFNIMARSN